MAATKTQCSEKQKQNYFKEEAVQFVTGDWHEYNEHSLLPSHLGVRPRSSRDKAEAQEDGEKGEALAPGGWRGGELGAGSAGRCDQSWRVLVLRWAAGPGRPRERMRLSSLFSCISELFRMDSFLRGPRMWNPVSSFFSVHSCLRFRLLTRG